MFKKKEKDDFFFKIEKNNNEMNERIDKNILEINEANEILHKKIDSLIISIESLIKEMKSKNEVKPWYNRICCFIN